MVKAIEETIKSCKACGHDTIHIRNTNKTTPLMLLVHLFLTFMTFGVWLVLAVIWMVLNKPIGGWSCKDCRS